jgi:hypothetical protein
LARTLVQCSIWVGLCKPLSCLEFLPERICAGAVGIELL